jgi:hypothetical protein
MAVSRKRRIVRRVALALIAVVLLPVWYVSSYCATWWLAGRDPSSPVYGRLHSSLYWPLIWYEGSGHPGGYELCEFRSWCYFHGGGDDVTWVQFRDEIRMSTTTHQTFSD